MAAVHEEEIDETEDGDLMRAKGVLDGSVTLAEAAQKAHALGAELQRLHDEGYVLDGPIEDDYGFYRKPAS
jgi:hypothetical protein